MRRERHTQRARIVSSWKRRIRDTQRNGRRDRARERKEENRRGRERGVVVVATLVWWSRLESKLSRAGAFWLGITWFVWCYSPKDLWDCELIETWVMSRLRMSHVTLMNESTHLSLSLSLCVAPTFLSLSLSKLVPRRYASSNELTMNFSWSCLYHHMHIALGEYCLYESWLTYKKSKCAIMFVFLNSDAIPFCGPCGGRDNFSTLRFSEASQNRHGPQTDSKKATGQVFGS